MASKAFPALVLLALVCGELVMGGQAQTYIGGPIWTRPPAGARPRPYTGGSSGSPAGMQPPAYTSSAPGDDGTGRVPGVEEEKAFMFNSLPPHDRVRPVPVSPTSN